MVLFLDANAHLPPHPKAMKAYVDFSQSVAGHGHPSSPSEPGRLAATAIQEARQKIAHLIGAKSSGQIIFTANCTQACEWAVQTLILMGLDEDSLACSPIEHPAVKEAISENSNNVVYLEVERNGIVKTNVAYDKISCIHVQNEIGTIQPLEQLQRKYLFSDMSQSLGKIPINVTQLNVDIAAFGAHKFGGPGGFGFMYLKNPDHWQFFGTGSRYFLDRTGTPDVAGAVATAVALEEAIESLPKRTENMVAFQETLERELTKMGIEILGQDAPRVPSTTFISIPGKGMKACFDLGQLGIYVGLGSACGSFHSGNSPLMTALNRKGSVSDFMRISQFGEYGEKEAKDLINSLRKVL